MEKKKAAQKRPPVTTRLQKIAPYRRTRNVVGRVRAGWNLRRGNWASVDVVRQAHPNIHWKMLLRFSLGQNGAFYSFRYLYPPPREGKGNSEGWWEEGPDSMYLLSLGSLGFGPGGYSYYFWVCRPVLKTLTLFQTKMYDFPYPISDLTLKMYTLFQTLWCVTNSPTLNRFTAYGTSWRPKRLWQHTLL